MWQLPSCVALGLASCLLVSSAACDEAELGLRVDDVAPPRTGGKTIVANSSGNPVLDAAGRTIQIPRKVTASRWTFIIGRDGRIVYRETVISPVKVSQEVLDFVRKANAE